MAAMMEHGYTIHLNLEQCRRLKNVKPDTNINELGYRFGSKLFNVLDGNPATCNWEAFLAVASDHESYYNLSLTDVNVIRSRGGSPSERVMWIMGSRGMKAFVLVFLLDKLRLENILMDIKEKEPIVILKNPPAKTTVTKGESFELSVEGLGFPYPRYQWFKSTNGTYEKLQRETDKTLRIRRASQSDAGTYRCRLQNGRERSDNKFSTRSHVMVISPPPPPPPPPQPLQLQPTEEVTTTQTNVQQNVNLALYHHWQVLNSREGEENAEMLSEASSLATTSNDFIIYKATAKVAILIGNSDYMADDPLHEIPLADIQLLTPTLQDLDFIVFSLLNLTKSEMNKQIDRFIEFIRTLGKDVYVMFCYFGHGFEDSEKCYLVPTDASHGYGMEECICADTILNKIRQRTDSALIVMVLDTCRKRNDIASNRSRGNTTYRLASLDEPNQRGNTVVLYSTIKGLSAYQDRTHGMLVKSLNKQIKRKSGIINVMTAVQEDLRKEFRDRPENQIPEFKSNLSETKRCLKDSIDITVTQIPMPWKDIFVPPDEQIVAIPELGIRLHITFCALTLNILLTTVKIAKTFVVDHNSDVSVNDIKLTVEELSRHLRIEHVERLDNVENFIIKDIQKLRDDLKVWVTVKNTKTNDVKEGLEINLRRPLISVLELWKNKL